LDVAPADERGAERQKRLVDVGAAFVADSEATEVGQPRERAFHHSAVPAQTLTAVEATQREARSDPAPAQDLAAAWHAIGLIRMELGWAPAGSSSSLPDRRHSVGQILESAAVVNVGGGEPDRERDAVNLRDDVPPRTGPTAISQVRAGALTPLLAGTYALPRHA
jgi:nucleoid-associated protein YgaU